MSTELRQHRRYDVSISAEIQLPEGVAAGTTQNLSEGGVGVQLSREALTEGSTIGVELLLVQDGIEDPDSEPLALRAEVAWAAPSDGGGQIAGLRFVALSSEQRARLATFLGR